MHAWKEGLTMCLIALRVLNFKDIFIVVKITFSFFFHFCLYRRDLEKELCRRINITNEHEERILELW